MLWRRLIFLIFLSAPSPHIQHSVYSYNSSQTVHSCFFSYRSLPAWPDHGALLSDPSSCPHCMVVLCPASESATYASSCSFNQQFSPHGQPRPATFCTLMSRESQARTSRSSFFLLLSSCSQYTTAEWAYKEKKKLHPKTSRWGSEHLKGC